MPSLKLPSLFTDHAVLQHSQQVPIWGWCEPAALVTVSFRGQSVSSKADANGRFEVRIDSLSPGGPFELVIHCGNETATVHDVLVGEVWVCSGQSNMEWPLANSDGGAEEAAQAVHSKLRLFAIPQIASEKPESDVPTKWTCCRPETVRQFTAVGYHFGKQLHTNLHLPVGLIQSAWGGTTAEAWTSREALVAEPALQHLAQPSDGPVGPHTDPGISPEAAGWQAADLDETGWRAMPCPQAWERTGLNIDGAVWFRKTVEIPDAWLGKSLALSLGVLDDFDQVWVNGQFVGQTGSETPSWYSFARRYTIPAEVNRAKTLVVTIRIFDQWGDGGLMGPQSAMFIAPEGNEQEKVSLSGVWKFRVELELPQRFPASAAKAMVLYNAMIHPLLPYTIAGAIWYQGESNIDRAFEYRTLFPAMIQCWRHAWGYDLPFLFVLLAGWHAHPLYPGDSKIAELRDAQLAALKLPKTAAASAVDIGDVEDIHPRNKRDVGSRLAAAALGLFYGQEVETSGPVLKELTLDGSHATLSFTHASGLHCRGEKPLGFAVAGEDGVYRWADAVIEGETVKLHDPENGTVASVRFAWDDNPLANLYNSAGLPMVPFRTDQRAYLTAPRVEEYGRLG